MFRACSNISGHCEKLTTNFNGTKSTIETNEKISFNLKQQKQLLFLNPLCSGDSLQQNLIVHVTNQLFSGAK